MKIVVGSILLIVSVFFLTKIVLLAKSALKITGLSPQAVVKLLFNDELPLASQNGRTNILILGMGGDGSISRDLTDTIIILSIRSDTHTAALISLPRDLWSDTLQDKINTGYHYGEEKKPGGGFVLSKLIINEITGLPIHYVVRLDFSGFKEIIDLIGGIDITVPNAFTDPQFPVPGMEDSNCDGDPSLSCRYQDIHFDAGWQHMDGARALIYVRSRHSDGLEGSDFARNKRQQEVLLALQQKFSHPQFWLNFRQAGNVLTALGQSTQTDMNINEIASITKAMIKLDKNTIQKVSIDSELTQAPKWKYDGRYVLVPKTSISDLHAFFENSLR